MPLQKYIKNTINEAEKFYLNLALKNEEYYRVYYTSVEDLPPMMDSGSELFNKLVNAKLMGKDNITSPIYTHPAIWDFQLSQDNMKNIYYYDGQMMVLAEVARINGWKDLEKRACDCTYSD